MVRREKQAEVREQGASATSRSSSSTCSCPRRPLHAAGGRRTPTTSAARPSSSAPRARSCASQLRAGALDARTVEVEVREKSFPVLPDPLLAGRRGDGRQRQGHAARPLRRQHQAPPPDRPRGARRSLLAGGARRAWWTRSRWRALAVERVQASGILFIDEIDKIAGPRGRPRPRRLAARACSATSCPSSRARRSPPSTARCAPTTSSSSPPAPSTSPSRPTSSPSCRGASRSASSWSRLTDEDLVRILTEPRNALLGQYQALLATEGVESPSPTRPSARWRASPWR